MRLNKYLSDTGICSRREADAWIAAGRVAINRLRAKLGDQVAAGDIVSVDGRPIRSRERSHIYLALNKPVGITCTTERHVRGNVIDFVDHPERIFPIGRLDKDSEGLLLLTSDGDIVNEVLRSEHGHEKEYLVGVDRPLSDHFLRGMAAGVPILDTVTKPCRVAQIGRQAFRIILTQGLNRQIRRMCEAYDYQVLSLKRVRIMHIQLGRLRPGQWRNLSAVELRNLLKTRSRMHTVSDAAD